MIEIIPAVMPQSFQELEEKIGSVRRRVKTVHLDVMDGTVTPSINWPFSEKGLEEMKKITSGEVGLPFWKDVNYEVDLMMQNPEESFAEWVNAGFHRIIVHAETTQKLLSLIKEWKGVVEIGIAIWMETNNEDVYKYIDAGADFVQFMGIFQIGFQGNPFDGRVFEKISKMREVYPELPISVDGGVSLETAPKLLEAGADRLVVGSAIFKNKSEFEGIDASMFSSVYDIGKSVEISDLESTYDCGADLAVIEFKKLASDFSEKKEQK
ncbi:MAG: hypothetical protein NT098_01925 [Candidatus Parcubacteria bacterium]|nr:hypothetical protein [Candidatus Parcubacteria bacterium]